MYQTLPITIPDTELYVSEPDKPLKHWTGNEMRKWLVLRGLKRSGKVAELRINIKNHKKNPTKIPNVIGKFRCPTNIIRNTLVSMNNMLCRLMQPTYSPELINETRTYIKIYLNCLASWNHYVTPPSKNTIWISTYSMLNILNLPSMMETFGPL